MKSSSLLILALLASTFLLTTSAFAQDQDKLLKVFRTEFVPVVPGSKDTSKTFKFGLEKKKTVATVGYEFEVAKYEIPQNLWESIMGSNPSRWTGARNSIEMLTFEEAVSFCQKATKKMRELKLIKSHQIVRLPTEVEWEFFARAGTETKFSFGDKNIDDYAWHTGNAAGNDPPVGAKKPNPWGLYDIHGYLWEWCLDSKTSPVGNSAWAKKDWKPKQAIRGGSWKDAPEKLASGYRQVVASDIKDDAVGLRCILIDERVLPNGFLATAQNQFVEDGKSMKLLWNEGEFTEGPAAAPDGQIYFSDIGNRLLKYDPASKKVDTVRDPSGRSNGLVFDNKGRLIACEGANTGGSRRISITENGKTKTLSDNFDSKKFNSPNDLALDGKGNVYFTDPRYVGDEPRELDFEGVFLVRSNGQTIVATKEVSKPNGILVSRDGKHVFIADHAPQGEKTLLQFDIKEDGTLTNKKKMFDFGSLRGIDGMAMDEQGNIYATAGSTDDAGIYVFSPTGKQLAFLKCPGSPTNCTFGRGKHSKTLFVTAAGPAKSGKYGLYSIDLKKSGGLK